MKDSDPECCWIFIDNSNLIIEGWKYYARKNKLIPGIHQDTRMRLDMGKLLNYITPKADRQAYLYGSEPPPMDTIWRAIRRQDIEVCQTIIEQGSLLRIMTFDKVCPD